VIETIENWKAQRVGLAKKPEDEINEWIDRGMAFLSTPEGTRSIYKSEYELAKHQRVTSKGLPKRNTMAAEVYVNTGTKEYNRISNNNYLLFIYDWISEYLCTLKRANILKERWLIRSSYDIKA